jgi:hypothetical protein
LTDKIRGTRTEVRKFGILFAVVFGLIGLYMLYRGHGYWYYFPLMGLVFLGAGLAAYPLLRPIYLAWMKFAFVLGWINTRILLGLFFYLIITPVGVGMRLFGKDLLDEKIDKSKGSYWQRRDKVDFDRSGYERLF